MDCIFCKINNNESFGYTVYEDEIVKVFLSIEAISIGHLLIVPKKHYINLEDIDIEVLQHINKISKDMYSLLKEKFVIDGLKIVQNNGSFQEVKHYHMHLIPHHIENKKMSLEEVYNILTK